MSIPRSLLSRISFSLSFALTLFFGSFPGYVLIFGVYIGPLGAWLCRNRLPYYRDSPSWPNPCRRLQLLSHAHHSRWGSRFFGSSSSRCRCFLRLSGSPRRSVVSFLGEKAVPHSETEEKNQRLDRNHSLCFICEVCSHHCSSICVRCRNLELLISLSTWHLPCYTSAGCIWLSFAIICVLKWHMNSNLLIICIICVHLLTAQLD